MHSNADVLPDRSFGQLFDYPFRIFFFSLAIMAVVAVPLWVGVVTGEVDLPLALPGLFWHQHEMLFGFLSAAIAGFLLTAVCVWTNTERMHGAQLLGLWSVWLVGRLMLAGGANLSDWLVNFVNLAFIPLIMFDAGRRIWKARQHRQWVILAVLALLWTMQLGFLLTHGRMFIVGGLVIAMALSGIVGGRITPAFSRNWLRQTGRDGSAVRIVPALDTLSLVSMLALLASLFTRYETLSGLLSMLAAILMLVRIIGWKGWLVASNPLLWILHLSLLWIPVALALLSGHLLLDWPAGAWLHAAGLGVIGGLVLGVISRVALGHTGRALLLPGGMVLAFACVHLAAITRVSTTFGIIDWMVGLRLAAALWVMAFALFLFRYAGILMRPRVDATWKGLP